MPISVNRTTSNNTTTAGSFPAAVLPQMPYEFQLLEPLSPHSARFAFTGSFEGQTVLWHAELLTLPHYYARGLQTGQFHAGQKIRLQGFIEIPDPEPASHALTVRIVHAIPQVDEASVLKTVIMLSNYKRLRRGRHGYGESYEFVG